MYVNHRAVRKWAKEKERKKKKKCNTGTILESIPGLNVNASNERAKETITFLNNPTPCFSEAFHTHTHTLTHSHTHTRASKTMNLTADSSDGRSRPGINELLAMETHEWKMAENRMKQKGEMGKMGIEMRWTLGNLWLRVSRPFFSFFFFDFFFLFCSGSDPSF